MLTYIYIIIRIERNNSAIKSEKKEELIMKQKSLRRTFSMLCVSLCMAMFFMAIAPALASDADPYEVKVTNTSHSPVASSTFVSRVYNTSSTFYLRSWDIYSDLATSEKRAESGNRTVVFYYTGFDSNFAQYSGQHYHYYY